MRARPRPRLRGEAVQHRGFMPAEGPHEAFFLNIAPPNKETQLMWKLIVGFIIFAAVALFIISKAGDKVDMSGEKHGGDAVHEPAPGASAPK